MTVPGLSPLKEFKGIIHNVPGLGKNTSLREKAITAVWCEDSTPNIFIWADPNASNVVLVNEIFHAGYVKALIMEGVDYCALMEDKSFTVTYLGQNWTFEHINEAVSEIGTIQALHKKGLAYDTMRRTKNVPFDYGQYKLIHFLAKELNMTEKQYHQAIAEINKLVIKKAPRLK